ncbi:hypothetical protein [Novosphingobium resinovorum]|uniref:hypothetical protein n=1 Tax=Novosphingobium resinovorum TaxID=158500 RepID=UPI002ED2BF78|nr:hypothetical protein [Novosphingobium resinovorum]
MRPPIGHGNSGGGLMWASYDKGQSKTIENRMSPGDRAEAERLSNDLRDLFAQLKTAKGQLAIAIQKYNKKTPREDLVRNYADLAIIAGAVIAAKPALRSFVVEKAKNFAIDTAKDKATEAAVETVVVDKSTSETILKIMDIVMSETPWLAALKASAPTELGRGDDKPNEVQYREDQISEIDEKISSKFFMLTMILNKYDPVYLQGSAQIQGPQMRAAPR